MKIICLLRRDEADLKPEERQLFEERFAGEEIIFMRADPKDYGEHLAWCKANKPDAILLPLERPVPSAAMEAGFAHVIISPKGLLKLERLEPIFAPF